MELKVIIYSYAAVQSSEPDIVQGNADKGIEAVMHLFQHYGFFYCIAFLKLNDAYTR